MLEQPRKREKRYAPGKGEDSFRNKNRVDTLDRPFHYENVAIRQERPSSELRMGRAKRVDERSAAGRAVRSATSSASSASSAASAAAKSVGKGVSGKIGSAGRTMKNSAVNSAAIASTAKSFGKGVSRASNISGMYEKAFGKKKPSRR